MYNQNSEQQKAPPPTPPPMSPSRISFSNDFVESSSRPRTYRDAPVSSDFEFSVPNYSMMSADQLFFKGRLLPLKEASKTTTLRDQLQNDNDNDNTFSLRPPNPKNPTRWRAFLGLRKSHIGSKKSDNSRTPNFHHHHDTTNNSSQEFGD